MPTIQLYDKDQIDALLSNKMNDIEIDGYPTPNSRNLVYSGGLAESFALKQNTLVSGSNIKTVNGESLLGSGNINIATSNEFIATTQNEMLAYLYNMNVGDVVIVKSHTTNGQNSGSYQTSIFIKESIANGYMYFGHISINDIYRKIRCNGTAASNFSGFNVSSNTWTTGSPFLYATNMEYRKL